MAIETSCDETCAAVIMAASSRKYKNYKSTNIGECPVVLSNVVSSQIDLHAKTGGIVPEVASRAHIEVIVPVIREALIIANPKLEILNSKKIQKSKNKISAVLENNLVIQQYSNEISEMLSEITHIAVTSGPGLVGALLVGFNTAKTLAYSLNIPIVPINHIEGHIYSAMASVPVIARAGVSARGNLAKEIARSPLLAMTKGGVNFPILALTVSGGHTSLTIMKDHGVYENIGHTIDDAAGEAFDKVAKLLGLGYPGGPAVSKLAEEFRNRIINNQETITKQIPNSKSQNLKPDFRTSGLSDSGLVFPRPMLNSGNFNFSFSGLKTAVLNIVHSLKVQESKGENSKTLGLPNFRTQDWRPEVAFAFEEAVVDVLATKTMRAVLKYKPKTVVLAGGVAANNRLRSELQGRIETYNHGHPELVSGSHGRLEDSSAAPQNNVSLLMPPPEMCGDNAAMIGLAAYYHIFRGETPKWHEISLDANAKL